MNQYYILEIQRYWEYVGGTGEAGSGTPVPGGYGHIVHFAYDDNATKARLKAEAKYHEVLASAAVSELPQHSATLITSDGRVVMNQCYKHDAEPAPEPTPEPEPEPTPEPEVDPE